MALTKIQKTKSGDDKEPVGVCVGVCITSTWFLLNNKVQKKQKKKVRREGILERLGRAEFLGCFPPLFHLKSAFGRELR